MNPELDRLLRRQSGVVTRALAARGILVVRFTHYRLTHEPEAVQLEILAILAARRIPVENSAKNWP